MIHETGLNRDQMKEDLAACCLPQLLGWSQQRTNKTWMMDGMMEAYYNLIQLDLK